MDVNRVRAKIDRLDKGIVRLLNQRAACAAEIGREKKKNAAPVHDPGREDQVVARAKQLSKGPLDPTGVERIYRQVIAACSEVQHRQRKRGTRTFADLANPWVARLGVYEPGRPIEEVARELGLDPDEVLKLASNENALGPAPAARKAMQKAIPQMHLYPDGSAFYLKEVLARALGVAPGMIATLTGSNEGIEFIGHVFLGPGTNIVMADRAFVVYALMAKMFQSDVIMAPMKNYTHDLDAMLKAITPETRVVFVANPNNPTSTMVSRRAIERFMAKVPDHVVVCFDEAYIELLPERLQPDTIRYVKEGRKVILLRTFSKTYGLAGLRIGYAIAPTECIQLMQRIRQPFNVNAMALAAAEAALGDHAYVRRTRTLVAEGLAYLGKEFTRMGLPYVPAVANFILVQVGQGRQVFEAMQKLGVIVRPMDGYGLPDHVRITVGTRRENATCVRALKKVLGNAEHALRRFRRGRICETNA